MRDYNTITAGLLKNAPHGIDCYVSNVSYADALHDIHCTGMTYFQTLSLPSHMTMPSAPLLQRE